MNHPQTSTDAPHTPGGPVDPPGTARDLFVAGGRLIGALTGLAYAVTLLVLVVRNVNDIIAIEVQALISFGGWLGETAPTGPGTGGPGTGGPLVGPVERVGEFGGAAQIVTVVLCAFAIVFFLVVFPIWKRVVETHTVRALACRPTGFFGFLLCGLIWFLLVIEIVIFVAFVLLFGLYALLNIMSILSYLGAVVTKGGS